MTAAPEFQNGIPGLSYDRMPVVVYQAPQKVSDGEMQGVMDAMRDLRDQEQTYGVVLDVRFVEGMTPLQRKMVTSATEGDENRVKKYCPAMALVFDSTFLKGMLTAIMWVKRPVVPMKVFTNPDEAFQWVSEQVQEKNGP